VNSFIRTWRYMSRKEKAELAEKVGVSKTHLAQIAGGHSNASKALIERLVEAGMDERMFV